MAKVVAPAGSVDLAPHAFRESTDVAQCRDQDRRPPQPALAVVQLAQRASADVQIDHHLLAAAIQTQVCVCVRGCVRVCVHQGGGRGGGRGAGVWHMLLLLSLLSDERGLC